MSCKATWLKRLAAVFVLAVPSAGTFAQDTRVVAEPKIPPVCAVLKAQLIGVGGVDGIEFADEARPDTTRLQRGIDTCEQGRALELASDGPRTAFLTGPINLKPGVTLLVDKGVTLFGSRTPANYDLTPGSCGVVSYAKGRGCKALITAHDAPNAGIMGDGVIDERGGAKIIVDGTEKNQSWWDMSAAPKIFGHKHNPRLISVDHSDNFTLYRITLRNSASTHVAYANGNGFTVWGVKIDTPSHAINTDGIVPYASKNITIAYTYIRDGDDNVALKADSHEPVANVSILHNHFYYGHGMSIGSGTFPEVRAIRVQDLSLDGTQLAGIRIKSSVSLGGLVHDVIYDDVCIRNSERPIQLDMHYTDFTGPESDRPPKFRDIVLRDVRISGGGIIILNGLDATHRIGVQLDGVVLDDPNSYKFSAAHADVVLGPGPVNFRISGDDTTESGTPGTGSLASCTNKFVPFPAH